MWLFFWPLSIWWFEMHFPWKTSDSFCNGKFSHYLFLSKFKQEKKKKGRKVRLHTVLYTGKNYPSTSFPALPLTYILSSRGVNYKRECLQSNWLLLFIWLFATRLCSDQVESISCYVLFTDLWTEPYVPGLHHVKPLLCSIWKYCNLPEWTRQHRL